MTSYEFTLRVENQSLNSYHLGFYTGQFFSYNLYAGLKNSYSKIIDNITYTYYNFEFASLHVKDIGLFYTVNFSAPGNGTVTVSIQKYPIVTLPNMILHSMPFSTVSHLSNTDQENHGSFLAHNWGYFAGGAVVIAGAGGGLMVLQRRRTSGF